jgi:uncharacterized membrane protein YbaN (DUF454 family)
MTFRRALVIAVGWVFLLAGIAGLFLPILQGILFILIGLVILSTEYIWAHHLLRRLHERFPKLARPLQIARDKARRWIHHEDPPAASRGDD